MLRAIVILGVVVLRIVMLSVVMPLSLIWVVIYTPARESLLKGKPSTFNLLAQLL